MKFKGQIWKMGSSNVVTIPKDYVDNGQIVLGKDYEFEFQEEVQ